MTDRALQNAQAQRDRAKAEIEELGQKIADLEKTMWDLEARRTRLEDVEAQAERFIDVWYVYNDGLELDPNDIPLDPVRKSEKPRPPKEATDRPENPSKEFVARCAAEIIREAKRPVGRADLYKALTERGVVLQGKDPEKVLSTMLWRMSDLIVNLRGVGYWLAGEPLRDHGGGDLTVPEQGAAPEQGTMIPPG